MGELKFRGEPPTSQLRGEMAGGAPLGRESCPRPGQARPRRRPPQQHLASLARRGLLKGEHLEVMPVGSSVLRVDVGAGEGREFHATE